jgi:pSer/pThr/pTyr-binding forkhead associated (FHA) protein/tetratricopeptide (TPR) repeat protein
MASDRRSRRRRPPPLPEDEFSTDEVPDEFPTDEFPPGEEEDAYGVADEAGNAEATSEFEETPIQKELARRGLKSLEEDEDDEYLEDDGEPPTEMHDPEDLSNPGQDEALIFGGDSEEAGEAHPTFVGELPSLAAEAEPDPLGEKTEILAVPQDEALADIPLLTVETADGASDVEVAKDRFLIGRSPDCDVVIPDQLISRNHAAIENRDDGWYIVDQNSGNGTFLNEERVTESPLFDGDLIQVGDAAITFTAPGSPAPDGAGGGPGRPRVEKTQMLDAAEVEEPDTRSHTSAGPAPTGPKRKKLVLIAIGCVVVIIGVLGIVKMIQRGKGPSPEEIARLKQIEINKRQEAALRRADATFTQVKEMAKQEKWTEARPLIQEVVAVVPDDPLVKEYQETIDREDRATKALLDAKAKVALEDFDGAILVLNTIPASSMYIDKAKELKGQLNNKRVDFKLESARTALQNKEYEKAASLANEVLLSDPTNEIASTLKHKAEAGLNKPTQPTGRKKKKKKRKKRKRKKVVVKPTTLLVGASLDAFNKGNVAGALSQASGSGVTTEGVSQLRKFQSLYDRGMELSKNTGQANKAETFLKQALQLNKKLGGGRGKITKDLHDKLGKVYFVKGADSQNRRQFPEAFKAFTAALHYRPDLKQAQLRIEALEKEALKLYETAYVIKSNRPDKAIQHCRTVLKMVRPSAYAYGRCKKLIEQLSRSGSSSGTNEDNF